MKRKSALIIAILIMAIGFAAVSTTLIINGNARVSENTEDFSVIFTKAMLDDEDVYANVISQDKKTITFETKDLKTLNQTSVLKYEVTNNSSNYDAEVTVNCKVKDNTEAKYTSIKNELENNATKVLAKETLNGTLTVTLNKTATEEVKEEYICTLEVNAVERDELGAYTGPTEWTFDYTGDEQTFRAPTTGTYKLETWGAQGGGDSTYVGGYGGYSVGEIFLPISKRIYLNVGEHGEYCIGNLCTSNNSYNGGGSCKTLSYDRTGAISTCGAGGGATHIALKTGLLSTLEDYKADILIVSGGGGGADYCNPENYASGGYAGGYVGGSSINLGARDFFVNGGSNTQGGTQLDGYEFGQGGTYIENYDAIVGGGGGFYGGKSSDINGAGGGSGYIGNPLLTEKSMYCYNCAESTEESTKTISITCVSETPTENCAKSGNGYARITLIQ